MEYTFLQKLLGFVILIVIFGAWYWVMNKAIKFIAKRVKRWWNVRKAKYYHEQNLRQNQNSVKNESEE